jgi:hypothetical protein
VGSPDSCLGNAVVLRYAVERRILQISQGFTLPFIVMERIIVVPPNSGSFLENGY